MTVNILIVDDIEANLITLEDLLEDAASYENMKIHAALSASEALEIALNTKIDLILSDIQMPHMSGFEMVEILKSSKKTKDIPVVFLTAAFKSDEFQKQGYEVGAVDYFLKPIERYQFINKINLYTDNILKQKDLESHNAYMNHILDSQKTFIFIISENGLEKMNQASLDFLGHTSFQKFQQKHSDISDLFIQEDGYLQAHKGSKSWLDVLQEDLNLIHQVKMLDLEGKTHVFQINTAGEQRVGSKFIHVISFTNITELINQKRMTHEISKLQNNLLMVIDKHDKMVFSNEKFLNFFSILNLDEFKEKYTSLSTLFINDDESFFSQEKANDIWIPNLMKLDTKQQMVTLIDEKESLTRTFAISITITEVTLNTIISLTEITTLAIEHKVYKRKAFKDELTGIYNRAFFNESLQKEFAHYKRTGASLSLIIFDIDHFKNFNDTYGHQVGDIVLCELAQKVQDTTRDTDIFARWGGEEFVKILPNTSSENAFLAAQKIRASIEEHNFTDGLRVTCSFGVHTIQKDDTISCIVKKADDALYIAKENGRNKVEISRGL